MLIEQAPAEYRPVIITLETQDDYDKLVAILYHVGHNKIHWPEQVAAAARAIRLDLLKTEE